MAEKLRNKIISHIYLNKLISIKKPAYNNILPLNLFGLFMGWIFFVHPKNIGVIVIVLSSDLKRCCQIRQVKQTILDLQTDFNARKT